MSETITIDTTEPATRTRAAAQDRTMTEAPAAAAAIDDTPTEHVDPEAALAQAHQGIEQRNQQIAELRAREAASRNAALAAEQRTAAVQQARVGDYAAQVEQGIAGAKSEGERARIAYKAAREAGDFEAEFAAQEAIADARFRFSAASAEKRLLAAGGAAQQQPGQQMRAPQTDQGGYTPAARAWIDDHPQFNSDSQYKAIAMAAHQTAIDDGIAPDSRAYFRHIEDTLGRAGFTDQNSGGRPNGQMNNEQRQPPTRGNAAPPSRGGPNGGGGGGSTVRTPMGDVRVSRGNGKLNIQIPPALRPDWEEGAKITKMTLADYAYEQVLAGEEIARGGNGGLSTEQGRVYK